MKFLAGPDPAPAEAAPGVYGLYGMFVASGGPGSGPRGGGPFWGGRLVLIALPGGGGCISYSCVGCLERLGGPGGERRFVEAREASREGKPLPAE